MSRAFYRTTRDLHLYSGLFISPFVLVFAISVFFLVHTWVPGGHGSREQSVTGLHLPPDLDKLQNAERVRAVREVINQLQVTGEVGFITHVAGRHLLEIPVFVPGRETTIDLDYAAGSAVISTRDTGVADALIYLHKSPGPHLAAIRGNWSMTRVWRWLADATVYLLLFISVSGIYLWMVLRAERKIGLALMAAGALSFLGIVYGLGY
ncbi:MAG: PepSY-associated TM helix domain-containing protein [Bryobacteraceae bacterium]